RREYSVAGTVATRSGDMHYRCRSLADAGHCTRWSPRDDRKPASGRRTPSASRRQPSSSSVPGYVVQLFVACNAARQPARLALMVRGVLVRAGFALVIVLALVFPL